MNTLQLSPISGTSATAVGASPTGEADPSAHPKAQTPPPTATSAAEAAQAAKAANATRVQAAQTAAAEDARAVARIETPSLNISVGLVGGTFDVYVDLTDPIDNRVVARLYGPHGGTSVPHAAPAKVRTEA